MATDPISHFKKQQKTLDALKALWAEKRDQLATLAPMLDVAVEKAFPSSFLDACRQTADQVRAASAQAESDFRAQQKMVDAAKKELGTELREAVAAAIDQLQAYQANVSLRDREGGQLVFEEVDAYLRQAKELHDFIYAGDTLAPPAVPESKASALPPAPDTPRMAEGLGGDTGLPGPQQFGLPVEMSEYFNGARNGYALRSFGEKFSEGLALLFARTGGSIEKTARYLAQYGLNGGTLSPEAAETLFRNAGISLQSRKVSLVSPVHGKHSGGSAIAAARAYLEDAIGLKVVHERCAALFNSGFRVTRSPAGTAMEEYTLLLQGMNKERLTELLARIARRLGTPAPTWVEST